MKMMMVMVIDWDLLRFTILSRIQAARCPSYPRVDIFTVRTWDLLVEDGWIRQNKIVSNGTLSLAPGPSHTHSGRLDKGMCPGPLPQVFILSEVTTLTERQRRWNWTAQLRRALVWNITLGKLYSTYQQVNWWCLWQAGVLYIWPWQSGGHHHWRRSRRKDSLCLQWGWLAERLDTIKSGEKNACLWQLCKWRKEGKLSFVVSLIY